MEIEKGNRLDICHGNNDIAFHNENYMQRLIDAFARACSSLRHTISLEKMYLTGPRNTFYTICIYAWFIFTGRTVMYLANCNNGYGDGDLFRIGQ